MAYTTLFLDLDNTLLDFYKAEYYSIKKVLQKHSLPYDDKTIKTYSDINDVFWKKFEDGKIQKEIIFEGRFIELARVLNVSVDTKAIADDYISALSQSYFKVDGANEILTYLKEKGYYLYATTNGMAKTQFNRIKKSGLEPFFDDIFISEKAGHQKPEKEYFDYVIDNIPEKNRKNMLIIGDSQSSDILGGINSGIDTCWYNIDHEEPKYKTNFEISKLEEIKNFL